MAIARVASSKVPILFWDDSGWVGDGWMNQWHQWNSIDTTLYLLHISWRRTAFHKRQYKYVHATLNRSDRIQILVLSPIRIHGWIHLWKHRNHLHTIRNLSLRAQHDGFQRRLCCHVVEILLNETIVWYLVEIHVFFQPFYLLSPDLYAKFYPYSI